MIKKVISGGQTGADMGGLKAAKAFMLQTGGTAPKNFRTENGANLGLGPIYGLVESNSNDYKSRTEKNILDSDGTVIFMYEVSPGSKLTRAMCEKHKKPLYMIQQESELKADAIQDFQKWIHNNKIQILNVAGNRESVSPGIERSVMIFLTFYFDYNMTNPIE